MTSDEKDVEKISESIDQSKLPEETDYMDEQFLDSLMKQLEQPETDNNTTEPQIETETK
jgi:gluconate kinase